MNYPSIQIVRRALPVDGKATVLVDDQSLDDIVSKIKHYHIKHKPEYDSISEDFWQGTPEKTARVLFDFNKKYITYKVEPESDQTIKRPGRLIEEGYGDCKHYSSIINGVVDSLARKGYPIECCYRFVSDSPSRDVHHVFAVVRAAGKEYWVDPVLQTFDERPDFYNTKDVHFNHGIGRLTYLSGTSAAVGSYSVGKKKQLFKHLVQSIKKGITDVTHVGLKVAMAPARGAVLALIDLNAFNLATRFANALQGPHGSALKQKWRDVGGNEKKLVNAVNNGLKHKAKHHHTTARKVNGPDCAECIGMGAVYHSRWVTTHPKRWVHEFPYAQSLGRRRHRRFSFNDAFDSPLNPLHPGVYTPGAYKRLHQHHLMGTAYIGEPMSIAAIVALASGLLAALSKFLGMKPGEMQAISDHAKKGSMDITEEAAASEEEEGDAKAEKLNKGTKEKGGAESTMSINTGVDDTGSPTVTVQDVKHPALQNAGGPNGGAASEIDTDPNMPPAPSEGVVAKVENKVKQVWSDYKVPIIITAVGVVLFKNKKIRRKLGF